MGLYQDENGNVVEMDDVYAQGLGYTPYTAGQETADINRAAMEARGRERGFVGDLNAALTGAASGLTLGGTDVLLSHMLTDTERQRLQAEVEANPEARIGGEIAGAIGGAFLDPMTLAGKTPAGYLSRATNNIVEGALETGTRVGKVEALAAMGAEGAIQNAGQYIGHAAIADKETTVEGMAGALGGGFVAGSAGGAAALGISKGTIAARKLLSKVMDGGEEAVVSAENAWSRASQEILDADSETAALAKQRLDDIRAAREIAAREQLRRTAALKEEQVLASRAEKPQPPITPPNAKPIGEMHGPFEEYGPIEPVREQYGPFENYNPAPPPVEEPTGLEGLIHAQRRAGEETKVGPAPTAAPAEEMTDLERQLAGTRDAVAGGKNLRDVQPPATADRIEVVRKGKPSERKMEIRTYRAGAAEPEVRVVSADEARKFADTALPEGYSAASIDTGAPYQIKRGIPDPKKIKKNEIYVARPSELAERGIVGNEISAEHAASVKAATGKLPPVDINVTPDGRLFLEDGNHRLLAAVDGDREVAINFKRVGPDFKPQEGAVDISARLRGEAEAPVAEPPPNVLGDDIARQEADLTEALTEFERAKSDMLDALATDTARQHPRVKYEAVKNNPDDYFDKLEGRVLGPETDNIDDLVHKAEVVTKYERASKKLAEVVGDGAHPTSQAAAKAFDEADKEATRKTTERMTRAAEDAEMYGPYEAYGPDRLSPNQRVKYARERKLESDAEIANLKLQEKDAATAYSSAKAADEARRKALGTITLPEPKVPTKTPTKGAKVADMGAVLEMLPQIPGIPKPHDIPLIGPLLGAYLKFRGIKAVMSRFSGRVALTGETRAAALAAHTKERIGRAIERSLGMVEKGATAVRKAAPPLAGIVSSRIFDDGLPDADKSASFEEKVTVRVRELAAYLSAPNAIERDVRRELQDVTDPDLIAAAEKHRRAALQALLDDAPKLPEPSPLNKTKYQMSPGEAMKWARRYEVYKEPASVYEKLEHEQDMITLEAAQTLRKVYPSLFNLGQQFMLARAARIEETVPYRTRLKMSYLYDIPLDASLAPDNVQILQSVHKRPAPPAQPQNPAPPMPSIAGAPNLTNLYQTGLDRRTLR